MTTPFSLFTANLNPSMSDFNALVNQLNAIFTNVSVAGDEAVSGNLAVTGTTALNDDATAAGTLTVTGLTTLNGGVAGGASADIAINTDKFTLAAATGNALIAGTLEVTGATTASGGVIATGLRVDAATTLTAVGTDRATSLALTASVNNITSAAAGTGVTLPACAAGKIVVVNNLGANAIKVYGAGADTVDGAAAATGTDLTNAKRAFFIGVSATAYISLMGVASA